MRLAEVLQPIKEATIPRSQFAPGIREYLEDRGYKFLGKGVDQMAFLEPDSGWVLKIFGAGKDGRPNPSHKMFFVWAQFCMAKPDNPFLPRFAGYEAFKWEGALYLQIRQERLWENFARAFAVANITYRVEELADDDATDDEILKTVRSTRSKYSKLNYLDARSFDLLVKTITTLYRMGQKNRWFWDLHEGNVLFRADGTPVLVDPWVL